MGKALRSGLSRQEAYSKWAWHKGDPRPPLLDGDAVRALDGVSPKWEPIPEGADIGSFTVLGYCYYVRAGEKGTRYDGWQPWCRCSCGWEGVVLKNNITTGKSRSCDACAKIKAGHKRWWKYQSALPDDAHRERLLNRLSSIISRCRNKSNARYESYGGRGIDVYQTWVDNRFEFLRYVQTLPGWDNPDLELDRTNNDKGYVPGNIRFVTRKENVHNRRKPNDLSRRIRELEEENARLRAEIARLRHS